MTETDHHHVAHVVCAHQQRRALHGFLALAVDGFNGTKFPDAHGFLPAANRKVCAATIDRASDYANAGFLRRA